MSSDLAKRKLVYVFCRVLCRVACVLGCRYRCFFRQRMPDEGPVLICANHQGYLDPVLVGVAFQRRQNFLARKTLFGFAPFAWLIETLGAVPIEREGTGIGGLKESLRRLKRGESLLIFPEGRRSSDGQLQPLQPGFIALARRGKATVLPVAIAGSFQVWPRHALLPQSAPVVVWVGEPVTPEIVRQLDDEGLMAELANRLRIAFAEATRRR
jgi:1-acyl-sn-glycerol-3-phosphate acyltransferase